MNFTPPSHTNLNSLSDEALHKNTMRAAANEKAATLILLEYLAEVENRRLYAIKSYSSLWEYIHKALGYSEWQASDRVNAVRLIAKVPEVKKELLEGNLSLTTISMLSSHIKREKCEPSKTKELLKAILGKSTRETECVLASETTLTAKPDQIHAISKDLTRITIEVNQEFLDLMKRTQELGGHPGSCPQELFKLALHYFVSRNEIKSKEIKKTTHQETHSNLKITDQLHHQTILSTWAPTLKTNRSRYISKNVKMKIRIRSNDQCEYIDPIHKRRCECRTKLEYDHIKPFAKNGTNNIENLRHYCRAHNQLAAFHVFGKSKVEEYFKN